MTEIFAAIYTAVWIFAVTFLATVRWARRRNPRRPTPSWARTSRRNRRA